jgi:3-isopropylmalate/(R)-2-methylmalate dehydratase large subunit
MTAAMTMTEKILAGHAGRDRVVPGDIVVVDVDCAVPHDLSFYEGMWVELASVWDPDRIAIIFDHIVPAHDEQSVRALERGRAFARKFGIRNLHDVGPEMGICHQVIADVPYARPGEILVCADSHTCSGGALNCAARGVGIPELIYVMAKGQTWFEVGETIRYQLVGRMQPGVAAKDVFLHLAGTHGQHVGQNVEFGGPGLAALRFDQRRQLATMCAEISAEFALFEPDDVLVDYLAARGVGADGAVFPDAGANYAAVRELDLSAVRPRIGLPDTLVNNTVPLGEAAGVAVNRAFIGSCANGTLEDLRDAGRVLRGRRVAPGVTLLVTPASQTVYRQAAAEGVLAVLAEAGAVVTSASCGMCAGFQGRLGPDDVCITSSTRNFKGRMGSPDARIYMGSSATVAASAVTGRITDPADLTEVGDG